MFVSGGHDRSSCALRFAPASGNFLSSSIITEASPIPAPKKDRQNFSCRIFPSGALTLHGYFWRPLGSRFSFRIVVVKDSRKARGAYIADYDATNFDPAKLTRDLVSQTDDVIAAAAYARTLPYVDGSRIAVVGCSFGGIESLLAAERATGAHGNGIVAAIDFAGAAMSWKSSPPLQDRLKLAAKNAKVPVFFIQAENDFDTTPSLVLSSEMQTANKPMRVKIFPPNGTTHEDGHHFCFGGNAPPWGNDVLDFLHDPMRFGD